MGLRYEGGALWSDRLSFHILGVTNFGKSAHEIVTDLDYRLYLTKHLATTTLVGHAPLRR